MTRLRTHSNNTPLPQVPVVPPVNGASSTLPDPLGGAGGADLARARGHSAQGLFHAQQRRAVLLSPGGLVENAAQPLQGLWPVYLPAVKDVVAQMDQDIRSPQLGLAARNSKMHLRGITSAQKETTDWGVVFVGRLSHLSDLVRAEMGPVLCTGTAYIDLYIARLSHALVQELANEKELPLEELSFVRKLSCCYAIEALGIQNQASQVKNRLKCSLEFDRLNKEFQAFGQDMPVLALIAQCHQAFGYCRTTQTLKYKLLMSVLHASAAYAASLVPTVTSDGTAQSGKPGQAYSILRDICMGSDKEWDERAVDQFINFLVDAQIRDPACKAAKSDEEMAALAAKHFREYRIFFGKSLRAVLDPKSQPIVPKHTPGVAKTRRNYFAHEVAGVLPQTDQVGPADIWPQHFPTPQMLQDFLGEHRPINSFFDVNCLKRIRLLHPEPVGQTETTDIQAVTLMLHAADRNVRELMGPVLRIGETYQDLYVVLCAGECIKQFNPGINNRASANQIATSYAVLALGLEPASIAAMRTRLTDGHFVSWNRRFNVWGKRLPLLAQTLDRMQHKNYIRNEKMRNDFDRMLTRFIQEMGRLHPTIPPLQDEPGTALVTSASYFWPGGLWDGQRAQEAIELHTQTQPKRGQESAQLIALRNREIYQRNHTRLVASFQEALECSVRDTPHMWGAGRENIASLPPIPESEGMQLPAHTVGTKRTAADADLADAH
jgi:hypothetical protein